MAFQVSAQDFQYKQFSVGGLWRWTVRAVLEGSGVPRYEVRDILSPYGTLRDSIPIPGDIITAMAGAIASAMAAAAPHILASPLSLTFTVDEGRGVTDPLVLLVTNDGPLGSLLKATLATSAAYLTASPATSPAVPSGGSASISVRVNSTALLASSSPYSGTVTVQDATASNNPVVIPVTIVVRPKAHINLVPTTLLFTVARPLSGPFPAVPSQGFTIQNTGLPASVLEYLVQKLTGCSPWLTSYTPFQGTLPGGNSQLVTVVVAPPPTTLPGTYTEILRVSGYSDNNPQDVTVTLIVT